MGVAELKTAFNEGAAGKVTAARAFLNYRIDGKVQWQILTFRGTDAAGQPFEAKSEELRPGTDVIVAAREFGKAFAEKAEASNAKVAAGAPVDGGPVVPGEPAG